MAPKKDTNLNKDNDKQSTNTSSSYQSTASGSASTSGGLTEAQKKLMSDIERMDGHMHFAGNLQATASSDALKQQAGRLLDAVTTKHQNLCDQFESTRKK